MKECPTCSKEFETEKGMKVHHSIVHDESIAYTEIECKNCGEIFERRDGDVTDNTMFCSYSCKSSYQNSGEGHGKWSGGQEEKRCEVCGNVFIPHRGSKGRFCSYECMGEWRSEEFSGENHWNWKEDNTNYYGENWNKMRNKVRKEDEVCQRCGEDGSNCLLDVHHIVPRKEFENVDESNTMENLILLCRSCHHKVEKGDADCPEPNRKA